MGKSTGIEWTGATWNPWRGCTKVSPGCDACYMFREQRRYGRDPEVVQRCAPATFNAPLRWREPGFVFTCSWSDFFHKAADPWRDEAWDIIRRTPHLTYQILTKRPTLVAKRLPPDWGDGWPNVWLGISAEDQEHYARRWPPLAAIPAAVRFVSHEPGLDRLCLSIGSSALPDWVITGGESGSDARPYSVEWARDLRDQCRSLRIAFFLKQLGARPYQLRHLEDISAGPIYTSSFPDREPLRLRDRKGANWSEWAADLRVREMPEVSR